MREASPRLGRVMEIGGGTLGVRDNPDSEVKDVPKKLSNKKKIVVASDTLPGPDLFNSAVINTNGLLAWLPPLLVLMFNTWSCLSRLILISTLGI